MTDQTRRKLKLAWEISTGIALIISCGWLGATSASSYLHWQETHCSFNELPKDLQS